MVLRPNADVPKQPTMAQSGCFAEYVYVKAASYETATVNGKTVLWLEVLQGKNPKWICDVLADYKLCIEVEAAGFDGWAAKEKTSLQGNLGELERYKVFLGSVENIIFLDKPANKVILCTPPRPLANVSQAGTRGRGDYGSYRGGRSGRLRKSPQWWRARKLRRWRK